MSQLPELLQNVLTGNMHRTLVRAAALGRISHRLLRRAQGDAAGSKARASAGTHIPTGPWTRASAQAGGQGPHC
eukprot:2835314-Lingulodinium_polyedra.AAC.1